jgi:glycine/D-amino acid oxidase-like deaminating enzyme
MGAAISHLRIAVSSLFTVASAWEALERRVRESPGIPLEGASMSFWMSPKAEISGWPWNQTSDEVTKELPEYADIVVIGSGISGCSFVREIFEESDGLKVLMLEARDVCSGATARNGGHITPPLYHDYQALVEEHGLETAREIIRFRLKHLPEILRVVKEEGTRLQEESQAREVQTYDAYWDEGVFKDAKKNLEDYLRAFEEERERGWRVLEKDECLAELGIYDKAVGALTTTAGAVHPYRLVTGILERLLKEKKT